MSFSIFYVLHLHFKNVTKEFSYSLIKGEIIYHSVAADDDIVFAVVYTCSESNPCHNGGTCYEVTDEDVINKKKDIETIKHGSQILRYYCSCRFGFKGPLCKEGKKLFVDLKFSVDWITISVVIFWCTLVTCQTQK